MPADLEFAMQLADVADSISLPRFGAADLMVTAKPDLTPGVGRDLAVETAIRERIARDQPDDLVVGEKFGGAGRPAGGGSSTRPTAPKTSSAASRCGP